MEDNSNMFIKQHIKQYEEKHFILSYEGVNKSTYNLPDPESMFKESSWQLENLQELKKNLNEVKSCLNDYSLEKWHKHTNYIDVVRDIVGYVKHVLKAELVTQAWCKFYEIASRYFIEETSKLSFLHKRRSGLEVILTLNQLLDDSTIMNENFTSVHLCEAPGAFVTALNHWLKTNTPEILWDWLATTLNPYYEGNSNDSMIPDDRLIRHTLENWYFGADNTGDIMNLKNLDALVKKLKSFTKPIKLITADGSVDCKNMPAEQESTVAQLQFCETVACMHILHEGGIFVLKVFTLFEHQSICLLYLLSCVFHEVIVTKPICSKAGNSERYVVCKNFKGEKYIAPYLNILRQHYDKVSPAKAMFNLRDIPEYFLMQIYECNKFFNDHQISAINYNIETYQDKEPSYSVRLCMENIGYEHEGLSEICMEYAVEYKLIEIGVRHQIVGKEIIDFSRGFKAYSTNSFKADSYNKRLEFNANPEQLLHHYYQETQQRKRKKPWLELFCNWKLRVLPENLDIQIAKSLDKVRSSYFWDAETCQISNKIDDIVQHFGACFSPADITTEVARQMSARHNILNLEFNCDSHRIIIEISDRLEKLEIGQTLVLIGYSFLTQFNIALLCLLANFFDVTSIKSQDYIGYYIELKTYLPNEKVLIGLREILAKSHRAYEQNMAILSIMPTVNLYECGHILQIQELNRLMIKMYISHVYQKLLKEKKIQPNTVSHQIKMMMMSLNNNISDEK